MAVMRGAIVAIIVSFVCVAARAQEAKPCPSDHICPVCTEQDGVRSCKVERLGQPELPQATAPLDASSPPNITVRAAAPLPLEYRACITAAANKLPSVSAHGIREAERCRNNPRDCARAYIASQWRSTSVRPGQEFDLRL